MKMQATARLPDGPFMAPEAALRQADVLFGEIDGPFARGAVIEPSTELERARRVAGAPVDRRRFAAWSDADDRTKGRRPRDQAVGRRALPRKLVVVFKPVDERAERRFVLQDFKVDGAALRPEHRAYLADVARWMAAGRAWRVVAEAHASRTGSARHDDALSEDRYLATRAFLEAELERLGVAAARVRIAGEGVGYRHTRTRGEDPEARSVYVVISSDPSPLARMQWSPGAVALNWVLAAPPAGLDAQFLNPPSPFGGIDVSAYPTDAWIENLERRTSNIVWTGVYLREGTGWIEHGPALTQRGWGLTPIFADGWQVDHPEKKPDRVKRLHLEHVQPLPALPVVAPRAVATTANARRDAQTAASRAQRAGLPKGSVIYLDVEQPDPIPATAADYVDGYRREAAASGYTREELAPVVSPAGAAATASVIAYFTAWMEELARLGFRPGAYASFRGPAAQLARTFPRLYVWVFNYVSGHTDGQNAWRRDGDRVAAITPPMTQSAVWAHPASRFEALAYPMLWQFSGDNSSFRRAIDPHQPDQFPTKFDVNCSLVREPSTPQAEPRLRAAGRTGGRIRVAVLRTLGPQRGAAGEHTSPMQRQLVIFCDDAANLSEQLIPLGRSATTIGPVSPALVRDGADRLHVALPTLDGAVLVAHEPPAPAAQASSGIFWPGPERLVLGTFTCRPDAGLCVTALGTDLHLCFADASSKRLVVISRSARGWQTAAELGSTHTSIADLSALAAATPTNRDLAVAAYDGDRRLRAWRWTTAAAPASAIVESIGSGPETGLFHGPVGLQATGDELDVVALSADSRSVVHAAWTPASHRWTELVSILPGEFSPHPLTSFATVSSDANHFHLFALALDGTVRELRWSRPANGRGDDPAAGWTVRNVGGTIAPHPLSDLAPVFAAPADRRLYAVSGVPGDVFAFGGGMVRIISHWDAATDRWSPFTEAPL